MNAARENAPAAEIPLGEYFCVIYGRPTNYRHAGSWGIKSSVTGRTLWFPALGEKEAIFLCSCVNNVTLK